MAQSMTDQYLENNRQYALGEAKHKSTHPGKQRIQPAKRVAVVAWC
jgi:carbonic anhydrase